MQIPGQNNNITPVPQVQYNSTYNCGAAAPTNGTPVPEPQVQQPQVVTQPSYPQGYYYPPNITPPPATTSGVNIQIFNPAVMTPNGTTNVNAPVYYPGGYYTGQIGPQQPAPVPPQPVPTTPGQQVPPTANPGNTPPTPPVPPNPPEAPKTEESEKKKTEKRKIVLLTDDYIKNLENYLNSQNKAIRLSGAKEVFARLEEDDSRKDDKALNALINKMLQDPADEVRFLALTALENRMVTGDDYTVKVLKEMQKSDKGFGQDAIDAANILLKMSGQTAEKEFEVTNKPEKTEKEK